MNNSKLLYISRFFRQLYMVGKCFQKEQVWGIFRVFNNVRVERLKFFFDLILFGGWCGWIENEYEFLENQKLYLDGIVYMYKL